MTKIKMGLKPMHPGELLREEVLPALKRNKAEIARLLGVSRQTLYDILGERQPVMPAMALRLGKLCGNGPDLWLNLQKTYDLRQAEGRIGAKIQRIPTLREGIPTSGACRRGRKPPDPHHLHYMQPRALGQKASDQFVAPVCRPVPSEIR
jgi:antitoxin HigA-1